MNRRSRRQILSLGAYVPQILGADEPGEPGTIAYEKGRFPGIKLQCGFMILLELLLRICRYSASNFNLCKRIASRTVYIRHVKEVHGNCNTKL